MAPTNLPQNPTSHNVASLLPKLQDADPDIRYMTLNDLHKMLETGSPNFLSHDYTTCCRVVDGLLHTLADSHGDVQNMAIQCLGPFVQKAPETILCPTIDKVSSIRGSGGIDNSIPALGVRAIVVALHHPVAGVQRSQKVLESYSAVSKVLIPRLVGRIVVQPVQKGSPSPPKGMLQEDLDTGNDSNSLDLLTEVARSFGPMLQDVEIRALEQAVMQIIESERCGSVMTKKAVIALAALAPYFSDALLSQHVTNSIERLRSPHLTSQQRKTYISVFGSLARAVPSKFGPYLKTLAPFVLSPLSELELEQQREAEAESDGERDVQLEEVREAALVAVEAFLLACAEDMKAYNKDVIDSALRFLKYEPNVADDDEEMEEDAEEEEVDGFEMEEDFEEETGFDDEDDASWKVRRCSAKALHALVETVDASDPVIYQQIAPALIARFKEREESVRTEVIATLAYLITKIGSSSVKSDVTEHIAVPQSRKRRRALSDSLGSDLEIQKAIMNGYASPTPRAPVDKATQGLANINPEIVRNSAKLLRTSTAPTKQVVLTLLRDMLLAQQGGLSGRIDTIIDPVLESLGTSAGTSASASNLLRIEALALLRAIAETHPSEVLTPHLGKVMPALIFAASDRYAKVSVEALATIECYVKALTPPRSASSHSGNGKHLTQLSEVLRSRITANDTDTEVRQKAVQALGLLIGRTSGSAGQTLLSGEDRYAGQQIIADRMKNELTRLPCVRAVDTIAVLAQSKEDFKPGFVAAVSLELGAQLRKASRSLRGASLSALRMLAVNQASRECLDDDAVAQLVEMLIPLLKAEDLHMMAPTLVVLAAFAKDKPAQVATPAVIAGICGVVASTLSGAALDGLLTCVESIGAVGAGKDLMAELLKVGVNGDTDVTGQVIGTLLVSGGKSVGVDLDAFTKELKTQKGESNKCLALSVLGEAGLRMGHRSPLTPESFTSYFEDESEKVKLAAAVALGRAGAGNVQAYLPKIINALTRGGMQYLLLYSVKELLQHSTAEDEIKPYTQDLWQMILSSGQSEDNKVVGAECLGRLAIIDPAIYLKQIHILLRDANPRIRGMTISALRYIFADADSSCDEFLKGTITSMLETMLADTDLDNQRLSLSAFNSAFHNKPDLVLPYLPQLLPFAMQATHPRPELVRQVTMGPFKHRVDDGLEIRKSAYETLYALLDSPASRRRLDVDGAFYDRIVAGIADEQEIKILCCLVLSKLLALAPAETARRLDALAAQCRAVLAFKPKDSAVKQELEKLAEQNKAVVKVAIAVNKAVSPAAEENRAWREFYEWVRREFAVLVKLAEDELKEAKDR